MVSFSTMLALTGTSPRRFSVRVGVTVARQKGVAILRTTFPSFEGVTDPDHSANPPARTTIVRLPPGTSASVNRPSGPVTVCCSRPLLPSTLPDAPETAPLASSRTIPDTDDWAAAAVARASEKTRTKAVRMTANLTLQFACVGGRRPPPAEQNGASLHNERCRNHQHTEY